MTQKGLVTITLSVYNLADRVGKAIESVLAQTYPHWELIAIDDASSDSSYQILQAYAAKDPRIKAFRNTINRGTYWNRNRAILFGTGEFITNIDADDAYYPNKLQRQIEAIGPHAACFCGYSREGASLLKEDMQTQSNTVFFRRKLIEEIGYFDTVRFGADTEYKCRLTRRYSVIKIPDALFSYTYRADSLTSDPATGRQVGTSGKKHRLAYSNNYFTWYQEHPKEPYLGFPQVKRRFPVGHAVQAVPKETYTVSLATFPKRQPWLKQALDSIYPWVDRINIFLNGYKEVPSFLQDGKITTYIPSEDMGDRGKFYWADQVTGYHFLCDDDIVYSLAYFEWLANRIEKFDRQAIVGIHGSVLLDRTQSYYSKEGRATYTFRQQQDTELSVDFLGTGVLAYHSEKITIPFSAFEANNMADVYLGLYARQHRIPLMCCQTTRPLARDIDPSPEDAIYTHSVLGKSTRLNRAKQVDALLQARW